MTAQQAITKIIKNVLSIVEDKGRLSKRRLTEELMKNPEFKELRKEVFSTIRFMFRNYLLEISNPNYGTIQLTEEGKNLLKKLNHPQAKVLIDLDEFKKEDFNFTLFLELIELKKEFAKKLNIPTSRLPKDIILELITAYKPVNVARLYQLKFIPKNVPFGFWEGVVNVINNFLIRHKINRKTSITETKVLQSLKEGKTIKEVSEEFDKNPTYIAYIVEKLILQNKISEDDLQDLQLFNKDYKQIIDYFKISKDRRLVIAKKILDKDYYLLRIGRAFADVSMFEVA